MHTIEKADIRIAVQKHPGSLTGQALSHLDWAFGTSEFTSGRPRDSKRLYMYVQTRLGNVAVIFARNVDLGLLVSAGAVQASIVGTDTLEEYGCPDVTKIRTLGDGQWNFVLAHPECRPTTPKTARLLVTPLPNIARQCLDEVGNVCARVIPIRGSSEIYPYLDYHRTRIEGILDISVTGETIRAHGLTPCMPPLRVFDPVLIGNTNDVEDPRYREFFQAL